MTILAFLFVIGILVFIHELGHFLLAKWSGVRVERFSLGFGKRLLGFRRGETEYLLSLLPFGGYVKMYGEGTEGNFIMDKVDPGSRADKAGFKSGDKILSIDGVELTSLSRWREIETIVSADPQREYTFLIERDEEQIKIKAVADNLQGVKGYSAKEYHRSFANQPLINRFLIVVAGPFMNFVLPFLFLPIVFMIGINLPAYLDQRPVIGYVDPNSPASQAGFEKGDIITHIEGKEIDNWKQANIGFQSNPDATLKVGVERNGIEKDLQIKATASPEGIVSVGLGEELQAKVASVVPGTPAESAGIKKGDRILSIDGENITDWYQMASHIRGKVGKEVALKIESESGEVKDVKVTPQAIGESGQGAIGITPYRDEVVKKYGFFQSIVEGVKEAAKMIIEVTGLLFTFLFKLITGQISLGTAGKTIAGPLLIAKVSGSAAESGLATLLQFTSFISINLGLINLLPIPMLDGGHVVYILIEAIKRRPLSQRTMEICQRVGFSFLIFIMFIAVYNDLSRLKGPIMESLTRVVDVFK